MTTSTAAAFGTDLYGLLRADHQDMVFSPLSVAAALRLAWYGARGDTAAELSSALHLDPAGGAPSSVPDSGGSFTFRMANTAWVQQGMPIDASYSAKLSGTPMTTLADADFARAPDRARAAINETIAGQTEQKIKDLLAPGDVGTSTRLVLANAVYLKARWQDQFPVSASRDEKFHPGDGSTPTVTMMHGTATRDYKRGDGYQAVLLPYADSPLAMAIVLPDGPLTDLKPDISALLDGMTRRQVVLALPRFRLETGFGLIPPLERLGITSAFTDSADFTGISTEEQLYIGAVAHKAFIDVDEHGTEAAAATALTMMASALMRPPPRVEMTVDRPFGFAIIDTGTGEPLFLGQLTTPR